MKKIVLWETLPYIGGGQFVSLKVANILRLQYEIVFFIPENGELSKRLDELGYRYYLLGDCSLKHGKKNISSILKYLKVNRRYSIFAKQILKEEKPDIIYAPGPASLPIAAKLGQKLNIPVIWHIHHIFQSKITRFILKYSSHFSSIKRIISVSKYTASQFGHSKKFTIIYNSLDDNHIFEKRYEDNKKLKIGHVGFIQKEKEQLISLEILKKLVETKKDVCLYFYGSVRPGHEKYYEELNRYIKDNNLAEFVKFMGYECDRSKIYTGLDAIIIPSYEGMPLVYCEAVQFGVTPYCINVGGAGEVSDLFCKRNTFCSPLDAANKLLIYNKTRLSQEEQKAIIKHLGIDEFSDKIKEVFESCTE